MKHFPWERCVECDSVPQWLTISMALMRWHMWKLNPLGEEIQYYPNSQRNKKPCGLWRSMWTGEWVFILEKSYREVFGEVGNNITLICSKINVRIKAWEKGMGSNNDLSFLRFFVGLSQSWLLDSHVQLHYKYLSGNVLYYYTLAFCPILFMECPQKQIDPITFEQLSSAFFE